MITGWRVWKMRFTPSSTSLPRTWKSGPRWSMVGRSIARRMRSGTLVGPGICRKWRPAGMGELLGSASVCCHNAAAAARWVSTPVKAPMTTPAVQPVRFVRGEERSRHALAERLAREVDGEILFDNGSRGRYSTDASIYQVTPVGVVVPRTAESAIIAMQVAVEQGIAILPRGAGTSQCGQTVGEALVIDDSKYLNRAIEIDAAAQRAIVEPGLVLDMLNARLRPLGLWYPVDVSTS